MENLNDILSSLTDDDIANLKSAAASLFGTEEKVKRSEPAPESQGMPDLSSLLGNAQMMAKLTQVMGAMNKKDARSELIRALKPLLSEKRRKRADEAMQLLRLFEILPLITQMIGGNKNE